MNIFATFPCPVKSAQYLDDKRVIKMILENAQMFSAVCARYGVHDDKMYRVAWQNHPCTLWLGDDFNNVLWLDAHSQELNKLYKLINRKFEDHKSIPIINHCVSKLNVMPSVNLTPFANCTTYKDEQDVHLAYRTFMYDKWENDIRKPKWENRERIYS